MKKPVKTKVGNSLGEQRCSSIFEEKKEEYCREKPQEQGIQPLVRGKHFHCCVTSASVRDKLSEHSFSFQHFAISH